MSRYNFRYTALLVNHVWRRSVENCRCQLHRKIKRDYFHRKFVVDPFHPELFTVFAARATNFHFHSDQPNRRRIILPENNSKSRPREFLSTNKYFGDTFALFDKWHLSSTARHLENALSPCTRTKRIWVTKYRAQP